MKLDVKKNAIKSSFWGIFAKIVMLLFPFIIRTIIIRILGSEYAGLGNLFSSILQVLSLAELGFGSAIVFSMYQPIVEDNKVKQREILNFYKKVYICIGFLILLIGMFVMPFLRFLIKGDIPNDVNIYILYAIYLFDTGISYFLFAYRGALFNAYQRQDISAKVSVSISIIMYIVQILLLVKCKNYYAYVICVPICTLLINIGTYIVAKKNFPDLYPEGDLDKEEKKSIYDKIRALMLHKVGGIVLNSADTIVISAFLGLTILANYNNYYYLLSSVSALIEVLFISLTAGIGNSILIDDDCSIKQRFYNILYINASVVTVCTCCFFALYQDFISIWVGKDKLFDIFTVILLCIYFYVHMIRRAILMYRDAAGVWKENQWQPIVSAVFNLVVNIILVQFIGIYGILISSILAQILIDIPWESNITTNAVLKENSQKYFAHILVFAMISMISMAIIYFIKINLVLNIYLMIVVELIVAILVPIILIPVGTFFLPGFKTLKLIICNKFNL